MKLNDVRKLAVRRQVKVRFLLSTGDECVVNEQGVGKVPALKAPPQFDLENEFSRAISFVLETPSAKVERKTITRQDLERMVVAGPSDTDHPHDHDE